MADPVKDTTTALDPCDLDNSNAAVLRTVVRDWEVTSNGIVTITRANNSTETQAHPYFDDLVISGCAASMLAPPNALTVQVEPGSVQKGVNVYTVATTETIPLSLGDPVDPRIDLVGINSSGNLVVTEGTPSPIPAKPTPADTLFIISEVWVEANATQAATGAYLTQVGFKSQPVTVGYIDRQVPSWDAASASYRPVLPSPLGTNVGADANIGTATLSAGTVTVNTTAVQSDSVILLTRKTQGASPGNLRVGVITALTSFVIDSDDVGDTGEVFWAIINPL